MNAPPQGRLLLDGDRVAPRARLRPHDPGWTRRYARERDRIAAVLGDRARRIEHVGATAVPGLAAHPVVDVLVCVADADDDAAWRPALAQAGYLPHGELLRSPDGAVHVHVCTTGGDDERRLIAFRDRLRRSPRLRARYEMLRRSGAR